MTSQWTILTNLFRTSVCYTSQKSNSEINSVKDLFLITFNASIGSLWHPNFLVGNTKVDSKLAEVNFQKGLFY